MHRVLAPDVCIAEVKMERRGIERQAQTSTVLAAVPVNEKPDTPIEVSQAILEKSTKETLQRCHSLTPRRHHRPLRLEIWIER